MRISPKQLLHGLFYSTPVLLLALAACGGGGGGGGSSGVAAAITATATPTAQILTVGSPMTPFSPLTASGGTPPYTYSNSGTLPGGVTMVPSTGVVSGAPSIAASGVTATMTFSVRDANNVVASTTSTVNFAVFGAWGGTKQLGASGATTRGFSTATDASGNVYVAGSTTGNLVSGIGLSTGNSDFFLSTFSAASAPAVTKQMGVSGTVTIGNSVATDASGNVYVAGSTTGNLVNNTSLSTNTTDMFLARYDSSGNLAASKSIIQLGVIGADTIGYAVATDASGNVYVAGSTTGNLDGNHSTVTTDMFLIKFNAAGAVSYTKQLGASGKNTLGLSVATDANGNVYVTGNSCMAATASTCQNATTYMFLTKYTASGGFVYTNLLGMASADTRGLSVATDSYGNVYVSGITTADFALGNPLSSSTSDSFLTKYDASGTKVYTRQLGVSGAATSGNAVATYANGNVFVAGDTGGALGPAKVGIQDFFLTKYGADGGIQ